MISYPETITLSEDTIQKQGNINVIQRGKITNTIKDSFPNLQLILDWYGAKVGNTSEKSSNISHYQDTLGESKRGFLIQNSFNSKHKFRKQTNTSSSIDKKRSGQVIAKGSAFKQFMNKSQNRISASFGLVQDPKCLNNTVDLHKQLKTGSNSSFSHTRRLFSTERLKSASIRQKYKNTSNEKIPLRPFSAFFKSE